MRKFLLLMLWGFALMYTVPTMAQQKAVSGIVTGSDNAPLRDVTVTVKGTANATKTNESGYYSIMASPGQVIVYSFVDHERREVTVGSSNISNVKLASSSTTLDEVVVAMDMKRNPKELTYSVQKVDGEELQQTQRENFISALQGRVAGATINMSSGMAGASSQIVLRGFNSLSLDNTPLFVIDGIVMDNSTMGEGGGAASLGLADNPANANRSNDYNNRMADINPNDIESITVLKGPEATALYGSQASSGAIIITTKKAKPTGKLGVAYDNSFRFEKFNRMPYTMNAYSGGTNNQPAALFTAFGPAYAGEKTYNNIRNFFETGFSQNHNLSLEYGKKNASFRFSTSLFNQEAAVPTNTYNRYNFRLSNVTKIGKYVTVSPAISYIKTDNDKPLRGASGYMISLLAWPANNDIRNYQDDNGLKLPLFSSNPNADFDNPLYSVYKNRSHDETDRITASLGLDIKPFSWLSLAGRFGYDKYDTYGWQKYDSMSFSLARTEKGKLRNYWRDQYNYNHTITAAATKDFGKFGARLTVGNQWIDQKTEMWAVTGTNLVDQNRTDSNNTDPITRQRLNNNTLKNLPNYQMRRTSAYFGELSLNWNKVVFVNYSHRFEESSIFPKKSRNYNYPAGGVSIIMSDLIPGIKSNAFNYWKLRGSVASTARSSAPYANQSVFQYYNAPGGINYYYYDFNNNNPELKPERQKTFEIGTEFRAINNRLNVDATYYNTTNNNLIGENFRFSYGTGFVLNTLNVGSNRNQGVEIALGYDVVKAKRFTWNTRFNFNKMWNKVLSLPGNVPEFYLADTWLYGNARGGLVVGGATTTITSHGYARNNKGQVIIERTTGLPVIDANFKVRGDRNPDFTLGWVNRMTMGNFSLSFLWDLKVGGDIFNATDDYLTGIGRSWRTYDRFIPRVIDGVLNDGLENSATPTANTISITPALNQSYYTTMPEEEFIEKDINWLRLRDVSLYYRFNKTVTDRLRFVKSLSAFVTLIEPILITNYSGTDPQSNGVNAATRGVGGFGFDYGNVGAPIGINLGIKANF
ncbi:MAG: SusC/RagA family TonB-linked outer membrane protein [Chitinophagaceae bacterium]|nr:MAG: SusC/RagA family TonB-linked outer membrane protein [Chitinophagaceae bacterium]